MIALPIWLWLVLFVLALIVAGVAWVRKIAVTDPVSRRAAADGRGIPDTKLEAHCKSALMQHEVTAPGQTSFVASLQLVEFRSGTDRAITPISLMLSELTMAVCYRRGALGSLVTVVINRRDVTDGRPSDDSPDGRSYSIQTQQKRSYLFRFASDDDQRQLAAWVQQTREPTS
jgi:hypothetical protein